MARIGSVAAAPFVGDEFAAIYLGAERVPTIPGKRKNVSAAWDGGFTIVGWEDLSDFPGLSAGEYKFYFDGVEAVTDTAGEFLSNFAGQTLRMSAINSVGEGLLSDPVIVSDLS
jgi:hypothetical protein